MNGRSLVYPVLSPEGQKEWEQIEEALYHEELTTQGYNKYRRRLFQKENFIPPDRSEKEKREEEKEVMAAVEEVINLHPGGSNAQKNSTFHSKEQCAKVKKTFCCYIFTKSANENARLTRQQLLQPCIV